MSDEIIELVEFGETFTLTGELRFLRRPRPGYDIEGNAVFVEYVKVLQQAWRGNRGSLRWEDVPLVNE